MTEQRATQLLVARALEDGEPCAPLLATLGWPEAASAAEAGSLERALRMTGLPPDLASLGAAWPAALRPALARVARLPGPLSLHAPLLQTTTYFGLVAGLQLGVLAVLQLKVIPALAGLASDLAIPGPGGWLPMLQLLDAGLIVGGTLVAGWAFTGRLGPTPPWHAALARAREAAICAALIESRAPQAVSDRIARECPHVQLGAGRATGPELDLVADHALGAARQAHARFVSSARVVGYGALVLVGFMATLLIYGFLPLLAGGI